jgi:hypothetical protein
MLKGENSLAPYLTLTNNPASHGIQSSLSVQSAIKQEGASVCAASKAEAKVTRRVAHEICEKRRLEEQESEWSKRVKSEGDVSEATIKQLVKQVEQEYANNENDVSGLGLAWQMFSVACVQSRRVSRENEF